MDFPISPKIFEKTMSKKNLARKDWNFKNFIFLREKEK